MLGKEDMKMVFSSFSELTKSWEIVNLTFGNVVQRDGLFTLHSIAPTTCKSKNIYKKATQKISFHYCVLEF